MHVQIEICAKLFQSGVEEVDSLVAGQRIHGIADFARRDEIRSAVAELEIALKVRNELLVEIALTWIGDHWLVFAKRGLVFLDSLLAALHVLFEASRGL